MKTTEAFDKCIEGAAFIVNISLSTRYKEYAKEETHDKSNPMGH